MAAHQHVQTAAAPDKTRGTSNAYQYEPLPRNTSGSEDGPSAFRLLSIEPGSFDDPLSIQLVEADLVDPSPPDYEALSYVWGSLEPRTSVLIVSAGADGQPTTCPPLGVTQNLTQALRHLRYRDRPRRMWVDAVCIDQSDVAERSGQVALMGRIFGLAARVVAWLGPADATSVAACRALRRVAAQVTSSGTPCTVRPRAESNISGEQIHRSDWCPFDGEEAEAVVALLSRPWFERVWVRQEIGLGSAASVVVCGGETMPWSSLRDAIFVVVSRAAHLPLSRERKIAFTSWTRDILSQVAVSGRKKHFGELRRYISRAQCADGRDRLYGALSLLWPFGEGKVIDPDYEKPTRRVYMEATCTYLASGTLDVLRFCSLGDAISELDLPSWVLDLSTAPSCMEIENHGLELWYQVHCAPPFKVDMALETLDVLAVHGATVTASIDIFESGLSQILDFVPEDFRSGRYRDGDETLVEAYCTTLASNRLFREEDVRGDAEFANLLGSQALPGLFGPVQAAWARIFAGEGSTNPEALTQDSRLLYQTFLQTCGDRVFFRSAEGYVGLAPPAVAVGDRVFTVLGCTSPLLLRPVDDGRYRLLGDCYCHGLMQSQAILGSIPEGHRLVLSTESDCQYQHCFVSSGGARLDKDPRVEALLRRINETATGDIADVEYLENMSGTEKQRLLGEYGGVQFEALTIV